MTEKPAEQMFFVIVEGKIGRTRTGPRSSIKRFYQTHKSTVAAGTAQDAAQIVVKRVTGYSKRLDSDLSTQTALRKLAGDDSVQCFIYVARYGTVRIRVMPHSAAIDDEMSRTAHKPVAGLSPQSKTYYNAEAR